jgi:hypothetical protein
MVSDVPKIIKSKLYCGILSGAQCSTREMENYRSGAQIHATPRCGRVFNRGARRRAAQRLRGGGGAGVDAAAEAPRARSASMTDS